MKFIEVEYNQDLKPLETVLSAVRRPRRVDFFSKCARPRESGSIVLCFNLGVDAEPSPRMCGASGGLE